MEGQAVGKTYKTYKTYKYKLNPTPEQERELGRVLGWCRARYNTALEQRIAAWQRRHISVSRFQQEAELKDLGAEMPEYAAIHAPVLQDVLARLDKTYPSFFRRVKAGEKAGEKAGFPRYQARPALPLLHLQRGWQRGGWQRGHTG